MTHSQQSLHVKLQESPEHPPAFPVCVWWFYDPSLKAREPRCGVMSPGAGGMLAMFAVSCCRLAAGAGRLLEHWLQGQD